MVAYNEFSEGQIKHLEMLQTVVARLGTDSFLVKGWAITVAGAFFGFAVSSGKWRLAAASVILTLIFWCLDTYFLRSERTFRILYDKARMSPATVPPFFMSATSPDPDDAIPPREAVRLLEDRIRSSHAAGAVWRASDGSTLRRRVICSYL